MFPELLHNRSFKNSKKQKRKLTQKSAWYISSLVKYYTCSHLAASPLQILSSFSLSQSPWILTCNLHKALKTAEPLNTILSVYNTSRQYFRSCLLWSCNIQQQYNSENSCRITFPQYINKVLHKDSMFLTSLNNFCSISCYWDRQICISELVSNFKFDNCVAYEHTTGWIV